MNEMRSAVTAAYGRRNATARGSRTGPRLKAESTSQPGLELAVYDDLGAAERLWRAFEPTADCGVFQSFEYLSAWCRHFGAAGTITPTIVIVRDGREVLAIFPLVISADRAFRRLSWLGQELIDYTGPLLAPHFTHVVRAPQFSSLWQEIRSLLQREPDFRHDVVDLRKMPERVGGQPNPFLTLATQRHASDGYVVTLSGDWQSLYRAHRSAKARRQDRAKLARLTSMGPVRMVTAKSRTEVERSIDTLMTQRRQTFAKKGIADPIPAAVHRHFLVALGTDPRARSMVHVSEFRVAETPVAVNWALEYRGRYSLCLVSYDERFSRDSPGALHLNELIRDAVSRGFREFDFLVGYQRLKSEWSDRRLRLYDHIAGATPRGRLMAVVLRALARAKRTIKTTPALWEAYSKLRALSALSRRRGGPSAPED